MSNSTSSAADTQSITERDAFEDWYVTDMHSAGFVNTTAADVRKLRDGDAYGPHRHALNGKWEGWKARAAIAQGAPA